MVSAAKSRLVVGIISSARSSNSRASISSVVRWANVVSRSSKTTSSDGGSGDFRVAETAAALLTLPELNAGTLGVAVGRAGAVALLLLVVLVDEELEGDGDEEEEGSKNSDSEASGVESADGSEGSRVSPLVFGIVTTAAEAVLGVLVSVTERCLDVASARRSSIAGQDSDSNHATAAKDVEDHGEKRENGLSAKAASQQDSEDGVEDNDTRHALNGLLPSWNGNVAVGLDRQEVTVDAENDSSAAELECVQEG